MSVSTRPAATFGKRGATPPPGLRPTPSAVPERESEQDSSLLTLAPKWLVGVVAAVLLYSLVSVSSGGLLGGFLGGLIASKFLGHSKDARSPAAADAQRTNGVASQKTEHVSRGGFGSTGRSSGFSFFGG